LRPCPIKPLRSSSPAMCLNTAWSAWAMKSAWI
jgi:hypothetical protein